MKNYSNIKILFLGILLACKFSLYAQENVSVEPSFEMGQGLRFNFNNGDYQVKIGGMIQPQIAFIKDSTADASYFLNSRRTYFNVSGKAIKEKVSFLLQTDFSLTSPLMDAWVCYKPYKQLSITIGQQIAFTNNREMSIMETQFQFVDRSILSTQFSSLGREFGVFIESSFNLGKMIVSPKAAITSGDGRNSFGLSSTDYDLGGVKYAGRLDFLPLGNFSEGNEQVIADIKYEPSPKIVLGAAGSINKGASHSTGEGHGSFLLYDTAGQNKLPDYRKLYYDVLIKYKGFSVLTEFVIATAKIEEGTYFDQTGIDLVKTTEISERLTLGTGFNTQIGYVLNKKYGVDVRYAKLTQEFSGNVNSVLQNQEEITYGFTRYFNENNLKVNASFTHLKVGNAATSLIGNLYVQLLF